MMSIAGTASRRVAEEGAKAASMMPGKSSAHHAMAKPRGLVRSSTTTWKPMTWRTLEASGYGSVNGA